LSEFKGVNPGDKYFSELMLRLVGFDKEGVPCSFGTAFVLRSYLLVTARHVVEEFLKRATPDDSPYEFSFTFWAIQIEWRGEEHRYNIWQVVNIYFSAHSDICLLHVGAYNDTAAEYPNWKCFPVSLDPPSVGEKVIGFGFHATCLDGSRVRRNGGCEHLELNDQASKSVGHVKQIYMLGRDSAMLPFPCFEVDCRFDPGMSGGLVINSTSELIGVICSSMIVEKENFSHVAMIWPVMAILVDFRHDGPPPNGRQPLSKLVDYGIWRPRGWERVIVEMQPNTSIPKVTYLG